MREQKEESNAADTPNFEPIYHSEAPWDIGRPQKEYIQLEQAEEIVGSVLDVGCGTGENALYLAEQGHEVWGIDFAPTAIQKAHEKVTQRHLAATFRVLNVLELRTLGRKFDTVIDSGLFHWLNIEERSLFIDNLAAVIRPRGTYFMLCISELTRNPDLSKVKKFLPDFDKLTKGDGAQHVTQVEIKELFRDGWRINYIRQATLESRLELGEFYEAHGWLSSISKE